MVSILTLAQINIILGSEEAKRKDLYGNLYEVLNRLHPTKAVQLDDLVGLNKKGKAALLYNKTTLLDSVNTEWYVTRTSGYDSNKRTKCSLCNTPNKYIYYIANRLNQHELNVGSDCMKQFSDIKGYTDSKIQMNKAKANQRIVSRRNEFHSYFPNVENDINYAEKWFNTTDILLPWHLYNGIQDTIQRMRLIYTKYVNENKKPFKSEYDSFYLFYLAINSFDKQKKDAELFIKKHIDDNNICRRIEIDWLIKQKKKKIIESIARNNGQYTIDTLSKICCPEFLEKHKSTFLGQYTDNDFIIKLHNSRRGVAFVTSKQTLYQPPLCYTMTYSEFMNKFGAKCILQHHFKYSSKDIIASAKLEESNSNIRSIINATVTDMDAYQSSFLFRDNTQQLIVYFKKSKSISYITIQSFLDGFSNCALTRKMIEKFIKKVIEYARKNRIMVEAQDKQGVYDTIQELYRETLDETELFRESQKALQELKESGQY